MSSTNKIFFDTDCLSSFLWVGREDIVLDLFPNLIVIPDQVYYELSKVNFLKTKIDKLIKLKKVSIYSIYFGTKEYDLYLEMTNNPNHSITKMIIGKGEASAIALTITNKNSMLASNNLRDIMPYIRYYSIDYILTEDIMIEAFNKDLITETEGNDIWNKMLNKRRRLPYNSFTECLAKHTKK